MSVSEIDNILQRAMAAHRLGDSVAASTGYEEVLRRDPRNPDALHLQGAIVALKDPAAGIALINRSLAVRPNSKEAHINLATIHANLMRMDEAERHFRSALLLDPNDVRAMNGLAASLVHLRKYAEAEPYLRRALELQPSAAEALINMGTLMDITGRLDDGMSYYERAVTLHPDNPAARQIRAMALLTRGDLVRGWEEYAWRTKTTSTFAGRFPFPKWAGEDLQGRKILIWTEQGLGDEIIGASMIPDLIRCGAKVVALCSPRILPILERSFPEADFIAWGTAPRDPAMTAGISYQASMSDLGRVLRPSLTSFPKTRALLKSNPQATAHLRAKYQKYAQGRRLVGVSWRSKSAEGEASKTIPLQDWGRLLQTPNISFISLQYGDVTTELAMTRKATGVDILHDPDINPLTDVDGFASQVAAMDLVISVSNTTVHVAGGLGTPVWAFIPSNQARLWYWFLERAESPWYPSARLFRQDLQSWERPMRDAGDMLFRFAREASTDSSVPSFA